MFTIQVKILLNQWCSKIEETVTIFSDCNFGFISSFFLLGLQILLSLTKIDNNVPHKLDFWKDKMNTKKLETDLNLRQLEDQCWTSVKDKNPLMMHYFKRCFT